uniref:Guanylate cyclase domain-containing protein n=1 Tax=Zooxanthella nutricula TaxID=1333877 RepID=A0A7S2IWT6_9DINO
MDPICTTETFDPVEVTPAGSHAGETRVTLDVEPPPIGRLSGTLGQSTRTSQKRDAENLMVRSYWCFCSTFADADGKIDYEMEDKFARIKYKHFCGAFMQTSFLMPFGAVGQATWAGSEEQWMRAFILAGVVAPLYVVYGGLTLRYENKFHMFLSASERACAEKILIFLLCVQSLAIFTAEFMRPQVDYGMLVMHIGFVQNFSPLGELAIQLVTAGFGLVPYVLLKVIRLIEPTGLPITSAPLDVEAAKATASTKALEILMPSVIFLYQSIVTMRRYRSMRVDVLGNTMLKMRRKDLRKERQKCEGLLTSMLPKPVIQSLKASTEVEPQLFNDVTVVFIQICDFSSLCCHFLRKPEVIVEVLNVLYLEFDRLSDQLSVYKVETVGDVYMAVVGCPEQVCNHADVAAHFALAVQESMDHLRAQLSCNALEVGDQCHSLQRFIDEGRINVRIGLNSGKLRAGVVGLECPRYKLVGDTVNTASRMESTCAPGKIQVSPSTQEKLSPGMFSLEDRGEISVKGKGSMRTSYLIGYTDRLRSHKREVVIEHGNDIQVAHREDTQVSLEYDFPEMCVSPSGASSTWADALATLRTPEKPRTQTWRAEFTRIGLFDASSPASESQGMMTSFSRRHSLTFTAGADLTPEHRFSLRSCSGMSWQRLSLLFLLVPPSQKQPEWMEALRVDRPNFIEENLKHRIASARNLTLIWLMILAAVYTFADFTLNIGGYDEHVYRVVMLFRAVGTNVIGSVYLLLITNTEMFRRYAQPLTLTMLTSQGMALLVCSFVIYGSDPAVVAMYGSYVLFYKVVTITQRLTLCALAVAGYVFGELLAADFNSVQLPSDAARNIAFLLIFFIFMACGVRLEEHLEHVASFEQKKATHSLEEIDKARDASSQLLESLLPPHVVDLVAEGVSPIAEHYSNVTVMFTDIKGFTALSSQISPKDLVDLLNSMYSAFDEIIVNWSLYKVEIIGDAYFVSAGCPPSPGCEDITPGNWAMRAVEVALALQRALARVTENESLQMRVGLHTGSVVAGVVGKKGPRYHLFGAAVGYAEKMESYGVPGRVHISTATHDHLVMGGHAYDFQECQIELEGDAGRPETHTTWLVDKKSKNKAALKMQKEILLQRRQSGRVSVTCPSAPLMT